MYHYRKTRHSYKQHNAADQQKVKCTFCDELGSPKIIKDNETMFVLPNRVSYDIFEGRRVTDHLMVIPKRHVESLKDFTQDEVIDAMNIIGEYESKGYNVYARGNGNISRSVKHQHTHLIKIDNDLTKAIFFIRKPYFLVNF